MKTKTYCRIKNTDMVKIGAEIQVRRKAQNISQAVVAQWLGVSQRHFGYFEKGEARLSERQLVTLNKKLTAMEEGDDTVMQMPLNLLSTYDFLKIIAARKEGDVSDIWLFGPEKHTVLLESALAENWASCIGSGATLHVIWRLDVKMENYTIGLFSGVASRIIVGLNKSPSPPSKIGSVHIYGIRGGNKGYECNTEFYRQDLQEHFKAAIFGDYIKVHDPVDISTEKFVRIHSLLDVGRFGPVLAYIGKTEIHGMPASPIAVGALIENVSQKIHTYGDILYKGVLEIAQSGWVFLATDTVYDLNYHCAEFQKEFLEL